MGGSHHVTDIWIWGDWLPRGSCTASVCDDMKGASGIYLDPIRRRRPWPHPAGSLVSFLVQLLAPWTGLSLSYLTQHQHGAPNNRTAKLAPAARPFPG